MLWYPVETVVAWLPLSFSFLSFVKGVQKLLPRRLPEKAVSCPTNSANPQHRLRRLVRNRLGTLLPAARFKKITKRATNVLRRSPAPRFLNGNVFAARCPASPGNETLGNHQRDPAQGRQGSLRVAGDLLRTVTGLGLVKALAFRAQCRANRTRIAHLTGANSLSTAWVLLFVAGPFTPIPWALTPPLFPPATGLLHVPRYRRIGGKNHHRFPEPAVPRQ